jgi:pimeloyl-ACP methyl ester carboxylesterase
VFRSCIPLILLFAVLDLWSEKTPDRLKGDLPTQYVDSSSGRIAFDDTGGNGPLVIAVPGLGDVREEYRYLTPFLVATGYRVVTVDVRGFGASSAKWSDYSAHAVGGDLLRVMDHLGQRKTILAGNSFAAGAAVWAAHDAPERVGALVLLGPVLRDPSEPTPWYGRATMAMAFAGPWRVHFWLQYWDSLFPTQKPPDHSAYRAALSHNLHEPGRMEALKAMLQLSKADTAKILDTVRTPTLVVMGTKDPDFDDPTAETKWISQQLGAQIELVTNGGHYPHVEMPEATAPRIVSFLQSLRDK